MRVAPHIVVGNDGATLKPRCCRERREKAVGLILEIVMDAFIHAAVPPQHFPSLDMMKGKIVPQVLRTIHELDL